MTLLGYLFGTTPAGFERAQALLPSSLNKVRRSASGAVMNTPRGDIVIAGEEALARALVMTNSYLPSVFNISPRKDGRRSSARDRFAVVAALDAEGYQPFVPGLTPPRDLEAEANLSLGPLLEKVQAHERGYQEEVSRWLIVAHFAE